MSLTAQACGCSHLLHQLTVLPETITWNVQPPQLNLSTRRRTYVQQDKSLKVQACEEGAEEWSTCSNLFPSSKYSRRGLLLFGLASAAVASPAKAEQDSEQLEDLGRDEAAPPPPAPASPPGPSSGPDTTITDRVFLDISICPNGIRTDRTLGDASQICSDPEPLGRIVIGLYGRQVPRTVANFKAMVSGAAGSSYEGSIFHRVLYGQYIQAGKQGSRERGEVARPKNVDRNAETISASSFLLRHSRPGTVSLSLSENDDDEALKLSPDYRNVEFLITTGPGPAPQLDNGNIVFGTVLEGLDVVAAIASVPTYKPSERIRQFNDIAEFLGDDRALNARNFWNRPLKSVVISKCGVLKVAKPSLPPGLP